ncbi:MAG: acetylornithine deacetylase [Hyphomicrobiaceae bacterium]
MEAETSSAVEILDRMVAFETISARPNLDFVRYVEDQLMREGVPAHLSHDGAGERANIHAAIGPAVSGGVVLNGHTDVVPVDGQDWTSNPFRLAQRDDRRSARGAVDMKGFLACMLAAVPMWSKKDLKRPIHVSMCYDEEIGGLGAPALVADMGRTVPRPSLAIVGEPTEMNIIAGHKGGFEFRTEFSGLEAHAADPGKGASAIFFAARFINHLEDLANQLADQPDAESPYDPPYTTLNVGTIEGGTARNIIPGRCALDWELRPLPGDDSEALLAGINDYVQTRLLPEMRRLYPDADIRTKLQAKVPALDHRNSDEAATFLHAITGLDNTAVVSFGTDAGHFCNAGISTAVFGPGSIAQAHKPDEYIEVSQIAACMSFFNRLGDHLAQ